MLKFVAPVSLVALAGLAAAQDCAFEHVLTLPSPDAVVTPFDVDGSAGDNVWMVGERRVGAFPFWEYHNYAAHWDGNAWTEVVIPSLDPAGDHNELIGVVVVSDSEAYAAGTTKWGGAQEIQIFRWDGDDWDLEALNIIDDSGTVGDLGFAGGDIWLVGERPNTFDIPPASSSLPLALRRNSDGSWEEFFVPPYAAFGRTSNAMQAVDGVSEDDAWAVGSARQVYTPGPSFAFSRFLVHWDGSEWTLDDSLPHLERSSLDDIDMIAPDKGWAVGYHSDNGVNYPMIVEYDGTGWTEIELEPLEHSGGLLRGVAALAADDVYAFGAYSDAADTTHLLIYHFDGSDWTRLPGGSTGGLGDQFMDATATPDGHVWGVGIYVRPDSGPLTQRLVCDVCAADFNADGVLNFFDVADFLDAFATQHADADLTNDTTFDFFDVAMFLDQFAQGCP